MQRSTSLNDEALDEVNDVPERQTQSEVIYLQRQSSEKDENEAVEVPVEEKPHIESEVIEIRENDPALITESKKRSNSIRMLSLRNRFLNIVQQEEEWIEKDKAILSARRPCEKEEISLDPDEQFLIETKIPCASEKMDYRPILQLENKVNDKNFPSYLDEFELEIPQAEVVVGTVPIEEIQRREKEVELTRIRQAKREAEEYRIRELQVARREREARDRLQVEGVKAKEKLVERELHSMTVLQMKEIQLGHIFRKAEDHMRNVISQQQAHISETYGELIPGQHVGSRRYRLEWMKIPQPVEIEVHTLRAIKDKVPKGNLCILVTLYDRLGGHPLSWTVLGDRGAGEHRPGVTKPFHHKGYFYNTDLDVKQKIYAVCPSQVDIRPANVFVFEIYLLGNRKSPIDQVVGWGVLPVCNPSFKVVQGRFRIPLLRGEMDTTIDKYSDIEDLYKDDLSCWLCNLYLEIRHLPKEKLDKDGQLKREYDVEIDCNNQLLRLESTDRKLLQRREYCQSDQPEVKRTSKPRNRVTPLDKFQGQVEWGEQAERIKSTSALIQRKPQTVHEDRQIDSDDESKSKVKRWFPRRLRRKDTSEPQEPLLLSQDFDQLSEDEDDDESNPFSFDTSEEKQMETQDELKFFDTFKFQVNGELEEESAVHRRFQTARKLKYMKHELLADLGLNKYYTFQFWAMLMFLGFTIWLRMYIHYLGEWVYLRGMRVPLYDFRPHLTTCVIKYTPRSTPAHVEIGLVIFGVASNIGFFCFLSTIAWVCQKVLGQFPNLGSRFIACYGIVTVLDPALIFLVDSALQNFNCRANLDCMIDMAAINCTCVEGDAFKLYSRFLWEEGSGVVGVFLTVIIYIALMCLSSLILYSYLLSIHMNGRMLDVYRRVHNHDHNFFIPHDFEVTMNEVKYLCDKAKRWAGSKGSSRKVSVCDYVLEDPLDTTFKETTTHVAIYELSFDGTRQIYRHFIRNPTGTVMEIFGDLSTTFGAQHSALESVMLSAAKEHEHDENTILEIDS